MSIIRSSRNSKRYLLYGGVLLVLGLLLKACQYFPESSFELASDSRLPKWIVLPSGLVRANVSVTLNYYTLPYVSSVTTMLQNTGKQERKEVYGTEKCQPGFQLKENQEGFPPGYPAYIPVTINGITEIIEHRKMEPIFYVTDDPTVWKQYREFGCDEPR